MNLLAAAGKKMSSAPPSSSSAQTATDDAEDASDEKEDIKNFLEAQSLELNVQFIPHPRKAPIKGNLVYQLGQVSFYLEQGVLFVQDKVAVQTFLPSSVRTLLERAKEPIRNE